ncbi:MAG: FliH/SctL family protein [bacterium]
MSEPAEGAEVRPFRFDHDFSVVPRRASSRERSQSPEQEAYEKACREGEAAGFAAGLERVEAVRRRLEDLARSLERSRQDLYAGLEEEMLALSLRIAEKVVRHEIRTNRSSLEGVLAAALEQVKGEERIVVRVCPEDLAAVQEALPALRENNGIEGKLFLAEDASISPGGCVVETDRCAVDARIERALEKIEEALRSA